MARGHFEEPRCCEYCIASNPFQTGPVTYKRAVERRGLSEAYVSCQVYCSCYSCVIYSPTLPICSSTDLSAMYYSKLPLNCLLVTYCTWCHVPGTRLMRQSGSSSSFACCLCGIHVIMLGIISSTVASYSSSAFFIISCWDVAPWQL